MCGTGQKKLYLAWRKRTSPDKQHPIKPLLRVGRFPPLQFVGNPTCRYIVFPDSSKHNRMLFLNITIVTTIWNVIVQSTYCIFFWNNSWWKYRHEMTELCLSVNFHNTPLHGLCPPTNQCFHPPPCINSGFGFLLVGHPPKSCPQREGGGSPPPKLKEELAHLQQQWLWWGGRQWKGQHPSSPRIRGMILVVSRRAWEAMSHLGRELWRWWDLLPHAGWSWRRWRYMYRGIPGRSAESLMSLACDGSVWYTPGLVAVISSESIFLGSPALGDHYSAPRSQSAHNLAGRAACDWGLLWVWCL